MRLGVILVCASIATAGCADDPHELAWWCEVEDVSGDVAVIETRIIRGGCDGESVAYSAEVGGLATAPTPPVLGPGTYGLECRAKDASCRWIAERCEEVQLPLEASREVVVTAVPVAPVADCALDECIRGTCRGQGDAGASDGGATDAGCAEGTTACIDDALATCTSGSWAAGVTCALGCGGSPPACRELVPSNIGGLVPLDVGTMDLVARETVYVDTDDGSIETRSGAPVRPAGSGEIAGVYYELLPAPSAGGVPLGVFAVRSLHVHAGVSVVALGDAAFVFLVAEDALIDGAVVVDGDPGLDEDEEDLGPFGPGGGSGGRAGESGQGFGGGAPGTSDDGGGGGGSFGTSGGDGGDAGGGSAGSVYGTPELIPLIGGSGGGGGDGVDGDSGGGGGGAVQISAGGTITISATGMISAHGQGGDGGGGTSLSPGLGGGGGGGSGGAILLEASSVVLQGIVAANGGGGAGGARSTTSQGDGGEDGSSAIVPAPGGSGGGDGGDGSNADGRAAPGLAGTSGGGGGGGAGRIRINTATGSEPYTLSPSIESGASSVGRATASAPAP